MSTQISSEAVSNEPNTSLKSSPLLHLSALDSLRGLAALYVCLGHAVYQLNISDEQSSLVIAIILKFFKFGHYAVALFIVLSGFCLMLPIIRNGGELRGSIKSFFIRRSRRILPPYYATLIIALILDLTLVSKLDSPLWNLNFPVNVHNVTTHLLLIHDLFSQDISKINSPLWSIAVEWRIYFLFPFLTILWRKWGGWKTNLLVLVVSYTLFFALSLANKIDPPGPSLHFFSLFSGGMLAADIVFNKTDLNVKLKKIVPWTLISIISLVLATFAFSISMATLKSTALISFIASNLLVGISGISLLVAVISFRHHPLNLFLNWNPLVKLGHFSYSIYLIHMPLIQILIQYVLRPLHLSSSMELIFIFLIGAPLVVCASYLFFLLVEKPFLSQRAKQSL